jgi:hypothetical protein
MLSAKLHTSGNTDVDHNDLHLGIRQPSVAATSLYHGLAVKTQQGNGRVLRA